MLRLVIAALAGYGTAVLLTATTARLARWWNPQWPTTRRAFAVMQATSAWAAAFGFAAHEWNSALVANAAAATAGWFVAHGYVLLLASSRR